VDFFSGLQPRQGMRISIYTFVKDGIFYDFHIVDMLKHHLPLADEIIVNEGYSSDSTFEKISGIDAKIKIFRSHWGKTKDVSWFPQFKDSSRQKCTGDWCILLDCDEFIPEWEFPRIRSYLEQAQEPMIPVNYINFYGNYKVYHTRPEKLGWPVRKMIIHRNRADMEVWGDGSNVRLKGQPISWNASQQQFACHHFGYVRNPARLRQKWRNIQNVHREKRPWFNLPSFLFDWRPHNWMDPEIFSDLAPYDGPFISAVRDNPKEFIRDNLELCKHVRTS
jgi:glycosyltransferase involved in cell wall biosynthesis